MGNSVLTFLIFDKLFHIFSELIDTSVLKLASYLGPGEGYLGTQFAWFFIYFDFKKCIWAHKLQKI